jgi:3-dehydroquinate dehydratase/shikimate dehydrogenase
LLDKAKKLASKVGGEAITLADLENFHPEEGMILANTTSVGMKPKIEDTPLAKVCLLVIFIFYALSVM